LITLKDVSKIYPNGVKAVDHLSLEVPSGQMLVLLGTSGSGKTTTMKMVNRLIEISSGEIEINGKRITEQNVIELRRNIGYAIQHIGLFPHMTVGENISVVPKLLEWSDDEIDSRVDKLLSMVGLPPEQFRDRYPAQLSGGQKQRIGVGRALAADPPVVLMDEPFGALDPLTREQLQNEFLDLQQDLQKTIIFVTHDVFEAVKMGDKIALLDEGKLQQFDTPLGLVEHPANKFVDDFLGAHRFQLSLLTRDIEDIVEPSQPPQTSSNKEKTLRVKSSIIEALDIFKKTKEDNVPVYRGKKFAGKLEKSKLLELITSVLRQVE
jgi:osmoprotectant transport system ATP-binding protein